METIGKMRVMKMGATEKKNGEMDEEEPKRSSLPPLLSNFVLHPPLILYFFLTNVCFIIME